MISDIKAAIRQISEIKYEALFKQGQKLKCLETIVELLQKDDIPTKVMSQGAPGEFKKLNLLQTFARYGVQSNNTEFIRDYLKKNSHSKRTILHLIRSKDISPLIQARAFQTLCYFMQCTLINESDPSAAIFDLLNDLGNFCENLKGES